MRRRLLALGLALAAIAGGSALAQTGVTYKLTTYRGAPIECGEEYTLQPGDWLRVKLTAPAAFEWRSTSFWWFEGEDARHKFDRDGGQGPHLFEWFPQPEHVGREVYWRLEFRDKATGETLIDCTFAVTRA